MPGHPARPDRGRFGRALEPTAPFRRGARPRRRGGARLRRRRAHPRGVQRRPRRREDGELTRAEAKTRADEARTKLVAQQGTFEDLVAKYSDDDISKPASGKIGNFERNVFPPAFSDAAFGLAVGGISAVVETPRGFHVIVRTQ